MEKKMVLSKEGKAGKGREGKGERGERRWGVYFAKIKGTRTRVLNSVLGPGPEFKTRARLSAQKSNVSWPF
jgi:hypothetical protein